MCITVTDKVIIRFIVTVLVPWYGYDVTSLLQGCWWGPCCLRHPFAADILLDQFSIHGAAYIIILDCQKEMNDRGSCKHRVRIHTRKLAYSGDFWLTSLDRQQQEGERNKELRRRGEVNKEKWCSVFHLFILVATQRLEAAWLRRTSSHWQPEARWVSADLIATHGTYF